MAGGCTVRDYPAVRFAPSVSPRSPSSSSASPARARMHHKVVGNFGSEADVRSLYFRGSRFNETSGNGACTHGQPAK